MKDKNYFEIFDMPITIDIDGALLTRQYYQLTMSYHPDRFTLKSRAEQEDALHMTSTINEAYRVLKDRQSRIKYILELSGVQFHEGKETVPQAFLMEMMDINESIMSYKLEGTNEDFKKIFIQLNEIENKIFKEISSFIINFSFENRFEDSLKAIKDYYLKNQYINNIKSNLNG